MTPDDVSGIIREPARLDEMAARDGADAVLDELRREHVAAYVSWLRPDWRPLADDRRRAVLDAAVQHAELRSVCTALVAAGITPLILKGAAWAFTHYPEPWCRPFVDLDLLVAPADCERASAVLVTLGYRRLGRISGELISAQAVFERVIGRGTKVVVDLHWQVSNRVRAATFLPARDVLARGEPAPYAAAGALHACVEDAMLIACLHPFAHHVRTAPLKWAVDVCRLAQTIDEAQADAVLSRAKAGGVEMLVRKALHDAAALAPLSGQIPLFAPSRLGPAIPVEADPWLDDRREEANDALDDLRALQRWRDRVRLIREHVLPPASFMREVYGDSSSWMLPWWYMHRLLHGAGRWIAQWWRVRR